MRYWSVCSGIEGASCAFAPLGWRPVLFAETDPFCQALLAARFPEVPNEGDLQQHVLWDDYPCDLLIGGTPCQSFSLSGRRKALRDPRGLVSITFFDLVQARRPRWVVWENVPSVLSLHQGAVFAALLHRLSQGGYGYAWRVMDACCFGVPQRRKRLYLVGCSQGDWRRAAQVLFDGQSRAGIPVSAKARPQEDQDAPDDQSPHGNDRTVGTLTCRPQSNEHNRFSTLVFQALGGRPWLRRLTPEEYEVLQGFSRGWTAIEYHGLNPASDHQRYRAVGNAFAVPVIAHIGQRIQEVHDG